MNGGGLRAHIEDQGFMFGLWMAKVIDLLQVFSIAGNMEDPASHTVQERPPNGSMAPAAFYSGAPRPSILPPSHRPSLLRHAFTPGQPTAAPAFPPQFSIVVGSSPPKVLASPAYGSSSTTIKKRGRPFKNPPGISTTPAQPIQKKRGRPFKTPNAAAKAAKAAGASTNQTPKKRGRPVKYPKDSEEVVNVVPPEPNFPPFICEWKNCPAELHNLDTLQGHLHIIHLKRQPSDGPFVCLWRKCYQKYKVVDAESEASRTIEKGVEFKTQEAWRNHVKAHLDHVARYQGEGPKSEWAFTQKPKPAISYSWRDGGPDGQATPSVKNQPVEGGRAKDNNAARFRKKREGLYIALVPIENPEAYMRVHDDKDDDDNDDGGDEADMAET